jgi:hypothetical protein
MSDVVGAVDAVDGAGSVEPDTVLNSSIDAGRVIPVGDTPRACSGIDPSEVLSATEGTGESGNEVMSAVVLKFVSTAAAQAAIARQRQANAACVAASQLTWQDSSAFVMARATTADWRGHPAYMSAGAVTSMGTGSGQGFRSAELAWPSGQYILVVRLREDTGQTMGTLGFPSAFASIPGQVETAANELADSFDAALTSRRADLKARAEAQAAFDRVIGGGPEEAATEAAPGTTGTRSVPNAAPSGDCIAYAGEDQPELSTRSDCKTAGSGLCGDYREQLRSWGITCEEARVLRDRFLAGETSPDELDGFSCVKGEDYVRPDRCTLGSRRFEF